MTPEEENVIIKLSCIIFKSCYDPKTLRQYGVLGDIEKYRGWKNAMIFLSELLQEVLEEKKELPTIEEAKRMLKESQKQNKEYLEFIDNKLEEERQKQKGLHDKK